MKYLNCILAIVIISLMSCNSRTQSVVKDKELPHVLIIGIDGLGAHGITMAQNIPNLDYVVQNGAYTLEARTILPSVSGPAWSTVFTGATPDRHSVGNNSWRVNDRPMEPIIQNEHGMFPTMFGEIRANYPEAILGAVYHWGTIGEFIEKGVCNLSIPADSELDATDKTCAFFTKKNPHLMYVHLDHQDGVGHRHGYRSAEYAKSVERTDSIIGIYFNELRKAYLFDKTIIFIVSDHGGINTGHGGAHADEMIVPLFIMGPGVKKGFQIEGSVFNYDIAPTIEWLFHLTPNELVSGKVLKEVFLQ